MVPIGPVQQLDEASVRLTNQLLRMLPHSDSAGFSSITDAVDALLGTAHELFFHDVRVLAGSTLPRDLGASFATEFWLPPDPEVGVLTVDLNVTEYWLETLLDDEPPRERRLAPLTPRDFGLVTFVLLHVADAISKAGFPPLVLSSEPPARAEALAAIRDVERVVEVVFGVTSGRSAGLVRLFVPVGMVRSLSSFAASAPASRNDMERFTDAFSDLPVSMVASLGHAMLTPSEARFLDAGDVILPAVHAAVIDGVESCQGAVALRNTTDVSAGWAGAFTPSDSGTWQLEIDRYLKHIQDEDMPREAVEDDQTEMLERASVRVEFRLGEVSLELGELADIAPGYVLDTGRGVGEGVDIVAGGRKIARGELVSIDGRLGIRVVSTER